MSQTPIPVTALSNAITKVMENLTKHDHLTMIIGQFICFCHLLMSRG
jgi:hypothetical protein